MGRRRSNAFKRNDAIRAIQSARDAGIEPSGLEVIVAPDGTTTFRVLGSKAATTTAEVMSAKEWDDEIAKLTAKKDR